MGEVLKIESEEAARLATELAAAKGISIEKAVEDALRAACANVAGTSGSLDLSPEDRERAFYELIKGTRSLWKPELLAQSIDDVLYDDQGMPG